MSCNLYWNRIKKSAHYALWLNAFTGKYLNWHFQLWEVRVSDERTFSLEKICKNNSVWIISPHQKLVNVISTITNSPWTNLLYGFPVKLQSKNLLVLPRRCCVYINFQSYCPTSFQPYFMFIFLSLVILTVVGARGRLRHEGARSMAASHA